MPRMADGAQRRIHAGCNVGNAAGPEGVCAEACALAAMVLAGGRRAEAVAVVGDGEMACRKLAAMIRVAEAPVAASPVMRQRLEG